MQNFAFFFAKFQKNQQNLTQLCKISEIRMVQNDANLVESDIEKIMQKNASCIAIVPVHTAETEPLKVWK